MHWGLQAAVYLLTGISVLYAMRILLTVGFMIERGLL